MKIELNLNLDTLVVVNKLLQQVYELPKSNDKRDNIGRSIGYDLADKFDKKTKTKVKTNNIFEAKKKFKITLKYHEAWAMQLILMQVLPLLNNSYQNNLVQNVINTLDQKLA